MRLLGFVALCLIWGTSWVAIKFSLQGFPPFSGAALRFLMATLFLFLYARIRGIDLRVPPQTRWMLVLTGLLVYVLDYGLIYWSEQHLPAGVTALFFSTFPIFTGFFSFLLLRGEPFRLNTPIGLIVGLTGVGVIFYTEIARTRFESVVLAASLAILLAAASGALSSVLVKKHLLRIHPVSLSLHQVTIGTTGLLLITLGTTEWSRAQLDFRALLAVVYLGLVASAIAFALYYWLLQEMSAITVSLVVYITPPVALLFDWLLLGQGLNYRSFLGIGLIFSGILLSQAHHYRQRRRAVSG